MKKIGITVITACLLITFQPLQTKATVIPATEVASKSTQSPEILLSRLNEINAMDKTELKSSEKKNLRHEVRSIKQQLREMGGGIYLSLGAIIIIVLLLIILL